MESKEDASICDDEVPVTSNEAILGKSDWIGNKSVITSVLQEGVGFIKSIPQQKIKVQLFENNLKLKKCEEEDKSEISDYDLRLMNNIKECSVVINNFTSDLLTPQTKPDIKLKEESGFFLKEFEEMSASDRDDFSDIGDSSGSDWEKDVLGRLGTSKLQMKFTKKMNKDDITYMNNTKSMITKVNLPHSNNMECSLEKANIFPTTLAKKDTVSSASSTSSTTTDFLPTNTISTSLQNNLICTSVKTSTTTPILLQALTKKHAKRGLPSLPHPITNIVSTKTNPEKYTFQLNLPFTKAQSNINLKFIPLNKISSIADNKNFQVKTVTLTNIKPSNTREKEKTVIAPAVPKQKITPPNSTQNNNNQAQRPTLRKILPKVKRCRKNIEKSSSTLSTFEERRFHDNPDDDDSNDDLSLNSDPILSSIPYSYDCSKCGRHFESVDRVLYHNKYSVCSGYRREATYQCDMCGRCFNGKEKLENHKNSHTNTRPFKCFDCDKHFNSKSARQMHHKNMHLNVKKRFLCYFCGYITPSEEHLLAHEKGHQVPEGTEVSKPFKCLVCGKGFISKWNQQRHKRHEHKLKKCIECSKEFLLVTELNNHLKTVHSIIKTYDCKECDKKFKYTNSLRNHRKTVHSTVLPYFCDVCDKGFKRKTNLQQHMITHSEERPISCPKCGDSFKRITHLKQHTAAFHSDVTK